LFIIRKHIGITEHLCESLPSIPGLIRRQLEVQLVARQRPHQVTQYHYTEWPDFGVPASPKPLVDLVHLLRSELKGSNTICLIHCSAGVGRTGTLMALNKIIEDIEDGADIIDVFQTVLELRSDRVLMVSQKCHDCNGLFQNYLGYG
jgi:protein tyrosine phosphatase